MIFDDFYWWLYKKFTFIVQHREASIRRGTNISSGNDIRGWLSSGWVSPPDDGATIVATDYTFEHCILTWSRSHRQGNWHRHPPQHWNKRSNLIRVSKRPYVCLVCSHLIHSDDHNVSSGREAGNSPTKWKPQLTNRLLIGLYISRQLSTLNQFSKLILCT